MWPHLTFISGRTRKYKFVHTKLCILLMKRGTLIIITSILSSLAILYVLHKVWPHLTFKSCQTGSWSLIWQTFISPSSSAWTFSANFEKNWNLYELETSHEHQPRWVDGTATFLEWWRHYVSSNQRFFTTKTSSKRSPTTANPIWPCGLQV